MDQFYAGREPLIQRLRSMIRIAVRILAVLMVFVIFWGVIDVAWVLYKELTTPPYGMLTINDILATFGAFMGVLIAIEIFVNINIYLRDDVIHVKIVLATALMAQGQGSGSRSSTFVDTRPKLGMAPLIFPLHSLDVSEDVL